MSFGVNLLRKSPDTGAALCLFYNKIFCFSALDTGLLTILGIHKFTELLGLRSKSTCMTPGLLTAVVMDDEASMDRTIRDVGKRSNIPKNHWFF